jgi:hypothetical protein
VEDEMRNLFQDTTKFLDEELLSGYNKIPVVAFLHLTIF